MALGFIGADHPRCPGAIVPICSRRDIDLGLLGSDPRIRNVVDDLLHTLLELPTVEFADYTFVFAH
jgi:hypothetical protein